MHDDRLAVQWVPNIMHLTDLMFGGIVLCCSTMRSATIRGSPTKSSGRNFRCFRLKVKCAVVNASADYCATTTAKPRKINSSEFVDSTPDMAAPMSFRSRNILAVLKTARSANSNGSADGSASTSARPPDPLPFSSGFRPASAGALPARTIPFSI